MATLAKTVATPKKRIRGLPVTMVALTNGRIILSAGAFYAMFIALIVGLLYPTISTLNFGAYLTSSTVQGLIGTGFHLQSVTGFSTFLGIELYGAFYGLLFGGILAYIAGSSLPLTIENGTLDLALSRPISRTRYYLELWLSAILGGIILSVLTLFAVWISTLFVKDANVDWQWLTITQLLQFAFLFFTAGMGMLFGSFINVSRTAGGAAVGIIFLAYAMNVLGSLSDKFNWLLKAEPFYYTPAIQALVVHDFTRWYPWVLVGAGLLCGLVGLVIFNRRDLPTV
jgi:ABC-2 type transport system permease protein